MEVAEERCLLGGEFFRTVDVAPKDKITRDRTVFRSLWQMEVKPSTERSWIEGDGLR